MINLIVQTKNSTLAKESKNEQQIREGNFA